MSEDGGLGGVLLGKGLLSKGGAASRSRIVGSTGGSRGRNGNLDGNLAPIHLLASKRLQSLLLLLLRTNIDESVTLATAGRTVAATDNASGNDVDVSFLEELAERGVVDVESEVGDEDNGLRRFAFGLFALGARSPRGTGLPGLLRGSFGSRGFSSSRSLVGRFPFFSRTLLGFRFALRK